MEEPLAGPDALPCQLCPEQFLQDFLESPRGQLISRVVDLEFALHVGIVIRQEDITYPEFLLLKQLHEERQKFEAEEIRKASEKRPDGFQPHHPPGRFPNR